MNDVRFCEYAGGPCTHKASARDLNGFFIYPSEPRLIAQVVAGAVRQLQTHSAETHWQSWETLIKGGHIIFCDICRAIHACKLVIANITTLNFNVLFELGFAIGKGKAVLPVRDATYERDKAAFEELGIFDNLKYEDFQNQTELANLSKKEYSPVFSSPAVDINVEQPIYLIRSPHDSDTSIKLMSCIKKGFYKFRTFDSREIARISLHEAYRQTMMSLTVCAHLMDNERTGARVHNARAAFICGMALAAGKRVMMLQEGYFAQPIDYRDVVASYGDVNALPGLCEKLLRATADAFQTRPGKEMVVPRGLLERIDLGDIAAENEIAALPRYFVKTPEYQQAAQGHARLIVGRKGSGKSAIFYGVRHNLFSYAKGALVLDLKPEGHQLVRLRETIVENLSRGMQELVLVAFWHYLLLMEIAKKVLRRDFLTYRNYPESAKLYEALREEYRLRVADDSGDFSERILELVEHVGAKLNVDGVGKIPASQMMKVIYQDDISALTKCITEYVCPEEGIWVLFDNIDKGWPSGGTSEHDIAILRALLDATRKLQRGFESQNIDLNALVFIRKDVHDLLVESSADRGKETVATVDWADPDLMKQLLLRRFESAEELSGDFQAVWMQVFDPHIGGEDSFRYILNRTLMRPRDVLNFVRRCVQTAVSRGHSRVEGDDIRMAERGYSEDLLNELRYEMRDVYPDYPDVLKAFEAEVGPRVSREDLSLLLLMAEVDETLLDQVIKMLVWFCFIGVVETDEETYAYQHFYNAEKLIGLAGGHPKTAKVFVIHPGFRSSLGVGH